MRQDATKRPTQNSRPKVPFRLQEPIGMLTPASKRVELYQNYIYPYYFDSGATL